ncbi:MAG: 2-iminoacetate synthase ThiH [Leptospiraceae bacterium]|nr:2-iminoacetate synthase ThiH [Leptospiraceae bacterium]
MFTQVFDVFSNIENELSAKTTQDVELTLANCLDRNLDFSDFVTLISKPASNFLEEMAYYSKQITLERFGKTIQMYMPLYLSNECRSSCLYCGFSYENKIPRKTLSLNELEKEAVILSEKGLEHILILTGEDYSKTPIQYIESCIKLLKNYFSSVSIEIYPMEISDYERLIQAGADGLALYQETYSKEAYTRYHVRGVKKDMRYRLDGPDRGGIAGFRKLGIGALLGLSEPRTEIYMLGRHAEYLLKTYWKSQVNISLPRMRDAVGDWGKFYDVSDREFLQFIFAFRIYFKDVGIILSTRESKKLRDNLVGLGITTMSAGSKTEPGGYQGISALEQFETEDKRSFEEVIAMIREKGFDPVLKDFDKSIL